jgi:hypothetical protein
VLLEGGVPVDALPVVLPEALPPVEPLAAGGLEGEVEGEAEEAEPALDGLDALLSRGRPFESLQCVEAEMRGLSLAPGAGDEVDCAETGTAPKHNSVVASRRDFAFMGTLPGIAPPVPAKYGPGAVIGQSDIYAGDWNKVAFSPTAIAVRQKRRARFRALRTFTSGR